MKKNNKILCIWTLVIFFTWTYSSVSARQTLQVVTKTITKQLNVKAGDTLQILAEKAQVSVTGWKGNEIVLKLDLISKHPKKEVAEEELVYLSYQIEQKDGILIRNYFTIDNGFRKVKGSLSARYEIKVPEKLAMKIVNKYGSLSINSFNGFMSLDTRFVNNAIENCGGEQTVNAIFGKTELLKSSGNIKLSLQKADLNVNYYTGNMTISSNYGFVSLVGDHFGSIDMESTRTTIGLTLSNLQLYNYKLFSNNSKVIIPGTPFEERKDLSKYEQSFGTDKPLIKITNTYKPITLNLQYNASNK